MDTYHEVELLCPDCGKWRRSGVSTTAENFKSDDPSILGTGTFVMSCGHEVRAGDYRARLVGGEGWREELRAEVAPFSAVIAEAVVDLAVASATPQWWIDHQDRDVTVYVAEPGSLHRLAGEQDEPPPSGVPMPSPDRTTTCRYDALRLAEESFELAITRTASAGLHDTIAREWIFRCGGTFELVLRSVDPAQFPHQPDPSAFARHLAALITQASSSHPVVAPETSAE